MSEEQLCPTFGATIYIAGDEQTAKHICRQYCFEVGLCVTIEPTTFIYTGGEEAGVRVGLINYPRFPTTPDAIFETACALGDKLMHGLCQHSYSVVGPNKTRWFSRRDK